jgi:hypothetical protein
MDGPPKLKETLKAGKFCPGGPTWGMENAIINLHG